jgi:hypothetical protein
VKQLSKEVKHFFTRLGITLTIQQAPKGHPAQGRKILTWSEGNICVERTDRLLHYYFVDVWPLDYGQWSVDIDEFKSDGYGDTGTCKRCGCSNFDACVDPDTGHACYWVKEDVCSACATTSEVTTMEDEFKEMYKDLEA